MLSHVRRIKILAQEPSLYKETFSRLSRAVCSVVIDSSITFHYVGCIYFQQKKKKKRSYLYHDLVHYWLVSFLFHCRYVVFFFFYILVCIELFSVVTRQASSVLSAFIVAVLCIADVVLTVVVLVSRFVCKLVNSTVDDSRKLRKYGGVIWWATVIADGCHRERTYLHVCL